MWSMEFSLPKPAYELQGLPSALAERRSPAAPCWPYLADVSVKDIRLYQCE